MQLEVYACRPEESAGRLHGEPESRLRTPHQRDRDRIVHATAFRRLEYKTQVFVYFEGDHFRTRLTHSLEVAQITRTICRALALNEDLGEAIALAHDLGHGPFGHAGEAALDEALRGFGGFDHNLQTFRVVTALERRYAAFDGLNLTVETLEGVVKHNGPLRGRIPAPVAEHPLADRFALSREASLEAQVAAISDDIAYCSHDVDDGLRAGFFAIEELAEIPLAARAVRDVLACCRGCEPERLAHETVRRLIDRLVSDLLTETRRRLARAAPKSLEEVRDAGRLVAFSGEVAAELAALRAFLHERVYRHYKVNRMALKAQRLVRELFEVFLGAPQCLPDRWRRRADEPGGRRTAETVRDYIAGMTDRYALDEHDRLFKLARYRL